ncbi:hypothetical protein D5E69_14320 [Rossellomorea marisflavi]|uniref:hypothetical protein n=1 Tax=Rossellomorea marisflavi TaxID=189381 RepID=UPI0013181B66|nr:hypothetical protein [Rossellomorea marisflavi]QHA36874.1 hypothetical protein D5E69_14320 [Rossellomorea marisflavi]
MPSKHWEQGELGTHSYAQDPFYSIHDNGKVDINPDTGTSQSKIELTVNGMYRMTKDWLDSNHMLSEEERATLIDLLAKRGKKTYNPRTKEWE